MIIDTTPDRPRVIGEIDLFAAQTLVHEDAIYIHESAQFHVDRLDWDERKAYVRRVDVDHYTYADRAVTLKPLDVFADGPGDRRPAGPRRGDGREPRHASSRSSSSSPTRTSAGARSTCPRSSSRRPPTG